MTRLWTVLCCLAFGPPALAQVEPDDSAEPPSEVTEEELRALEEALGQDAAARESAQPPGGPAGAHAAPAQTAPSAAGRILQGLNPDLSFVADFALAYFSVKEPLQGGAHDPASTGFTFQQLEMSVGQAVDPYFRFDGYLVFSQFGVEIEEAYATTLALPGRTQLRVGQFLTRFGRVNATHPHAWHFVDQPFAITRNFGGESNRGVGVEGSWLLPLPWYVEALGSVTDAHGGATARSFLGAGDDAVTSPLDFQFTGAVKQFFPFGDDLSLLWGLSAANGPNGTGFGNRSDVFGADLYLKYRPISVAGEDTVLALQAEALYRRRQVPRDVLSDVTGYAQVVYGLSHRYAVAARYEWGTPARGEDGRVAPDPLDSFWTAPRHRGALSATWWPTEFSRLRLQGNVDRPQWRDGWEWGVMLNAEFTVGAHGAHEF